MPDETNKTDSLNGINSMNDYHAKISGYSHNDWNGLSNGQAQKGNGELHVVEDAGPKSTDIAIVGMACRFPGGVQNPSDLWNLIANRKSGYCEVPPSRFNIGGWYHPDSEQSGSVNTRGGYFLTEDIRKFENGFFSINNMEAAAMDPQQRKLLEVTYECLENAGLPMEICAGANIGCYVGSFSLDFLALQTRDLEYLNRYSATGTGTTILSNRISHVFDLRGPSVVLDTACSSSLYTLHVACSALINGECEGAIVAAANLIQSLDQHMLLMKAGVLSPTSQCHTFDASADGYGRGEGVGALYIKRLSDALRDADQIRAVIRGTAVNSNGRTQGISQPSATAQAAVIRKAYAQAGLDPRSTKFVECHGTGTPVGDPIEISALSQIFSSNRDFSNPLLVGSIKTNIGHGEAVSGISAIIKVVLAFEKEKIPPSFGVKKLNPKIPFTDNHIDVVLSTREWPKGKRRAGVNSFGYGGANAHIILEDVESVLPEYRELKSRTGLPSKSTRSSFLLPISASNYKAMTVMFDSISNTAEDYDIIDLVYTLGTKRSHLQTRGFMVAKNRQDIKDGLLITTEKRRSPKPLAFIFTGQGAQWPQMGKELMIEFPTFLETIQELDQVLQQTPHPPDWSLEDLLLAPKESSKINHVTRSQPICTAVQVGLLKLLSRGNMKPKAVIGHSSGEVAAAYASGFITAAEAVVVAYYRGYAIGKSSRIGSMMAIGLGEQDAISCMHAAGVEGAVVAACINSPASTTLSGDDDAVDRLAKYCNSRGIFARKLMTGGRAYHSHHMLSIGEEVERLIAEGVRHFTQPKESEHGTFMVSSVTEDVITHRPSPRYWRQNMESSVRFCQAVQHVISTGEYHFVEIGPHSALEQPLKAIIKSCGFDADAYPYNSAMIRGKDSVTCFLNLVGNLFLHWHPIRFDIFNSVEGRKGDQKSIQGKLLTGLRPYPWNYDDSVLTESRIALESRHRTHGKHDLLGLIVPGTDGVELVWRNILSTKSIPWLSDYKLGDCSVFCCGGYLAMAMEAVSQSQKDAPVQEEDGFAFRQVSFQNMLKLPQRNETCEVFFRLRRQKISAVRTSDYWYEFEVTSYRKSLSEVHCTGSICLKRKRHSSRVATPQLTTEVVSTTKFKPWGAALSGKGLTYGPSFASLTSIKLHEHDTHVHGGASAILPFRQTLPSVKYAGSSYIVHPTFIEAGVQLAMIASTTEGVRHVQPRRPVFIEDCYITKLSTGDADAMVEMNCSARTSSIQTVDSTITCYNNTDNPFLELSGLMLGALEVDSQEAGWMERQPCLRVSWKPDFTRMDATSLIRFLANHQASMALECEAPSFRTICAALDIIVHKNSRMRILELGAGCTYKSRTFLKTLKSQSDVRMYQSYAIGEIDKVNGLSYTTIKNPVEVKGTRLNCPEPKPTFNLILLPEKSIADSIIKDHIDSLQSFLLGGGVILSHCSQSTAHHIPSTYSVIPISKTTPVFLLKKKTSAELASSHILLIETSPKPSKLASTILKSTPSKRIHLSEIDSITFPDRATVIVALEWEEPFLSRMNEKEMSQLKIITEKSKHIVWITGADMISGNRPEFGLVSGFSRAVMLEQPALRFSTYAAGDGQLDLDLVSNHAISILSAVDSDAFREDLEFCHHEGRLHVSRFVHDDRLNARFREAMGRSIGTKPFKEILPARLTYGITSPVSSIPFQQLSPYSTPLLPDYIEINVKAIGISAEDIDSFSGRLSSPDGSCAMEYCGIVQSVGSSVTNLVCGDRVVAMAPGNIQTLHRCPASACQKLDALECFEIVVALPLSFATAIYAIEHHAKLLFGQTVLIHLGASGVGIAAIQIAQRIGAEVFTTTNNSEEARKLHQKFKIPLDHIFSLQEKTSTFAGSVMKLTNGNGVDVILNSLDGDLLNDTWNLCAPFCRFVELSKKNISDAGKLDMRQFSKGVTFAALNLANLFHNPTFQSTWSILLSDVMRRFRKGDIVLLGAVQVLGPSDVNSLEQESLHSNGKIVISFEDQEAPSQVVHPEHRTTLSSTKTYVLVGCLGGLGRSLSKYMMKQGARKFLFLGRSGCERPDARKLVDSMVKQGATVEVIRGDVTNLKDVQEFLETSKTPIGGVVQAAMGLDEAIFSSMTNAAWHTGIQTKFAGTYNLHNALDGRDRDLEFFLMISSVSGSIGFTAESNYCASNSFLDAFARYRRSLGKPAMAVGLGMISEIGFMHEDTDTEARLLRKGIQALPEEEFLQIIDLALSESMVSTPTEIYDPLQTSHILTGLETFGVKKLRKEGFDISPQAFDDVRAASLAASLEIEEDIPSTSAQLIPTSGLPVEFNDVSTTKDKEVKSPQTIISDLACAKLSSLTLIPLKKIDPFAPIVGYGMDSLIAADYRTWFYQTFKVDVPFVDLFSSKATVMKLVDLVIQKITL